MAKHVKWDVRKGGDGLLHVTRTQVERSTEGTKTKTRIETDHIKTGTTWK